VEYQLGVLLQGLNELHRNQVKTRRSTPEERILIYWLTETPEFTRKDYRRCFPQLSTASSSRDLQMGLEQGYWTRTGEKNQSKYVRQSRTEHRGE
jgi:Fic family protein